MTGGLGAGPQSQPRECDHRPSTTDGRGNRGAIVLPAKAHPRQRTALGLLRGIGRVAALPLASPTRVPRRGIDRRRTSGAKRLRGNGHDAQCGRITLGWAQLPPPGPEGRGEPGGMGADQADGRPMTTDAHPIPGGSAQGRAMVGEGRTAQRSMPAARRVCPAPRAKTDCPLTIRHGKRPAPRRQRAEAGGRARNEPTGGRSEDGAGRGMVPIDRASP